jgi:hypothetical protein
MFYCLTAFVIVGLSQRCDDYDERENGMSQKALIHVKTVRRPVSQQVIGFRLEATIPNMAGRKMKTCNGEDFFATSEAAPSFRKPYFIEASGDYSEISPKIVRRFMGGLKWSGFDEFELIGKYGDAPFAEIMMFDATGEV